MSALRSRANSSLTVESGTPTRRDTSIAEVPARLKMPICAICSVVSELRLGGRPSSAKNIRNA